ncbi:MAG: UDP-N-acetylglucosamine 2-epimerase (non-hydrolyzing) [bacterium]|nr:UDP-N-acetylglucosamine 2-epimerase (non-hydrolyzing) [bacterium]
MNKFRLITLLGIRPDLIRMHKLIRLLDEGQKEHNYEHIFVHSGQHFDYGLDEVFYKELGVRKPDINLNIGKILKKRGKTNQAYQSALLFEKVDELMKKLKPDAVMYLGDTNTVTSSLVVAKNNIPVIHIEGGGRSFDWRMPEEKNRIIIDHLSDAIYCYLNRYKELLLAEGIEEFRIKVIGNIIVDALDSFLPLAEKSKILEKLGVRKGEYILCTLHREENVEDRDIFVSKIKDLIRLSQSLPVIFPVMPRVRIKFEKYRLVSALKHSKIILTKPLGFFDFLKLEKNARLIITDSGTVQEEALILGIPCLVSRRSTERPETIWAGATILSDENLYNNALKAMKMKTNWDRTVLNPQGDSPSGRVYNDLIEKIENDYFKKSRSFEILKRNVFVRKAYNRE